MRRILELVLLGFLGLGLLGGATDAEAQRLDVDLIIGDSSQLHLVILNSGSRMKGLVTEISGNQVEFQFQGSKILIPFSELEAIHVKRGSMNNLIEARRLTNHSSHMLLYNPSGFMQKKKEIHYGTSYAMYNYMDFGISDHFSVGFGSFFVISGMVRFKLGWDIKKFGSISVSNQSIIYPGFTLGAMNILQLNTSIGNRDKFISISGGAMTSEISGLTGVFTIGGQYRVRDNITIVTDNTFFLSRDNWDTDFLKFPALLSGAFRWYNKRIRVDGGIMGVPIRRDVILPFPYLGFGVRFGDFVDN